jgi:predicted Zn-dependent peptidase
LAVQEPPIHRAVLPCGAVLLTEEMPDVATVAFGVWADAGSADEDPAEYGVAHCLEHMLFKGTAQRTAYDIAEAVEDIGGNVDAYTERELTHVGARVLAEHLPMAVDIIADMVCHSTFPQEEFTRERQVIIEEIRKYQGVPEERIHDLLMEGIWNGGALGHAILGTEESVRGLTTETVVNCRRQHFAPNRLIITAAGNVSHAELFELAAEAFMELEPSPAPLPRPGEGSSLRTLVVEEDSEQINFSWGTRSFPASDNRVFPLALLDLILGASATSRLFQEVREKRGLAYDVGSYLMGFRDTGLICANGATGPETFPQVIELVRAVMDDLRTTGVTPHEWSRAKTQMKAGMALGLEGTADRMRRLAQHHLTWEAVYPLGLLMQQIDAVTLDDMQAVMDDLFNLDKWTFTAIGPISEAEVLAQIGVGPA